MALPASIQSLGLYHAAGTRSARVRWALLETVGDDFQLEPLQLFQGQQYSDEYLAKNPNHNVPMLDITWHDGSVQRMLESVAMVEWLADAFPDKQLAPAPQFSSERADYLQVMQFVGNWMDSMLWQIRMHEWILPAEQKDADTIQRYRDKITSEVAPQLAGRLNTHDHICGDAFTAADIVTGHCVSWAQSCELLQEPVFETYLARLELRPAYRQAFDDVKV